VFLLGISGLCGSVAIVGMLCSWTPDKAPRGLSMGEMLELLQMGEAFLEDEQQRRTLPESQDEGGPAPFLS
jgi:hypothetical protein